MVRKTLALPIAVAMMLGGCAPDAWNNRQATGFNGFVNQIGQQCAPMMLGRYEMSQQIQRNAMDDNYIYFLDQTSRVYYGKITQDAYRSSINGFFEGGATTDASINCILSKLPQNQK